MWFEGFRQAVQGPNLLFLVGGTLYGLIIGALPGLGGMFAVALALAWTVNMPAAAAIITLAAIHAACVYGDSWASILINTPGGVGSVASCWDGYPLTQKGRAPYALGISTAGSLLGGLIGWLCLVAMSPALTWLAFRMGPPELFMVGVLALSLLGVASRGETIKGLILGGLGLMLSFVGIDPIVGVKRFTMGSLYLEDGIPVMALSVGVFALAQAIVLARQSGSIAQVAELKGSLLEGVKDAFRRPLTVLRGGLCGVYLGILPALGVSTSGILAYFAEKRASKVPETFGQGNPNGLLAPEVAKNACIVGDLIPTLTLGIPGSAVTALFLTALVVHGIQPGPRFFQAGALSYSVFVGILLAQFSFFFFGMVFGRYLIRVVTVPNALVVPVIIALCFIGIYAAEYSLFHVAMLVAFAIVGYVLGAKEWPMACLVLGLVIGEMLEANFHRSVMIAYGSYSVFLTRPGSLLLVVVTVLGLTWPYLSSFVRDRRKAKHVPTG